MPMTRALLLICAAAALAPHAGHAQARATPWNVQLELGFNGASGNSSFTILRSGARARYLRTDLAEFEASVLVRQGKSEERVIADDQKASLKMDLWPQSRWSPFVFADWSRDEIRRLDTRFSGGAGAKLTVWSGESGRASVSGAVLYDYQNFAPAPDQPAPPAETLARLSGRSKLEKKLTAATSFEQVALFQPVWNAWSDYVLEVTHSLSTQILSRLAVSLEHQYLRDAVPPSGIEPLDQRLSAVAKVTF